MLVLRPRHHRQTWDNRRGLPPWTAQEASPGGSESRWPYTHNGHGNSATQRPRPSVAQQDGTGAGELCRGGKRSVTSGAAPKAEGEARHEKNGLEAQGGPSRSLTRSTAGKRPLSPGHSCTGPLIFTQAGVTRVHGRDCCVLRCFPKAECHTR